MNPSVLSKFFSPLNAFEIGMLKLWLALQFLTKFRIPHPGRAGGRFFIEKAMPLMLSWVLGGNRLDLANSVALPLMSLWLDFCTTLS